MKRFDFNSDGHIVQIPVPNGRIIPGTDYKRTIYCKDEKVYQKGRHAS